MGPIKEAFTFDDVTLAPNYSRIMPSDVVTETDQQLETILLEESNSRTEGVLVSEIFEEIRLISKQSFCR